MFRRAVTTFVRTAARPARREYNFASIQYVDSITKANRPSVDHEKIRSDTLSYLKSFDAEAWHKDPIRTVLNGEAVRNDTASVEIDTIDAFERVNGRQVISSTSVVDRVIEHAKAYKPSKTDLRAEIREIEAVLLDKYAGPLIGNQAKDFFKQDGVTEIEESIEANVVEHNMNDNLLADEAAGKVAINRAPALVGCVSNFSNFLDLCRKTLRNLEVGVPVIVLSRSNTTQHMYRWFQMLQAEMSARDMDLSMITYLSASIEDQRRLMKALAPESPLYLTGSREVARKIKDIVPQTFASTGGPNTMIATDFTASVRDATRLATLIENSGQCTAMRHLVAPGVDPQSVVDAFNETTSIDHAQESLEVSGFDAVYREWGDKFQTAAGYDKHPEAPVAFRFGGDKVPAPGIEEHWRRPYLDVTSPPTCADMTSEEFLDQLNIWLKTEQPITVAVNSSDRDQGFPLAKKVFENTSQVVFSVGDVHDRPSLTCQARPQDGEIFGELPPRKQLTDYTAAPMCVPSSSPSYNSHYARDYLYHKHAEGLPAHVQNFIGKIGHATMKGYCVELAEYLTDVTSHSPNHGIGQRTTLFGLQRPPLAHGKTVLRCSDDSSFSDLAPYLLPFFMTNAHDSVVISLPHGRKALLAELEHATEDFPMTIKVEDEASFEATASDSHVWNKIVAHTGYAENLPLVGQFVTTMFPMGHIKSTLENDTQFIEAFEDSPKWLKLRA